jgi:glutamine amidotransferase
LSDESSDIFSKKIVNKVMIAIVEYGAGNIFSLSRAVERAGGSLVVTGDRDVIARASHVILPGVGDAGRVMEQLRVRGLLPFLSELTVPLLGICVGMQVMCSYCEEGNSAGMSLFSARVNRLKGDDVKIPHMGWNRVFDLKGPLFEGIPEAEWFYFVHSYAPSITDETSAISSHGERFSAALARDNFFGTQFHPEKSGEAGERVLRNFISI